jgi:plastocyanin
MKKSTLTIIVAALVLIVGGGIVWAMLANNGAKAPSPSTSVQADVTDFTGKTEVAVAMHDLSFSPTRIKIKKGTTVTWTNQDTVAHNVVASDPNNTGGLATTAATFGRGGTFSFTFKSVGTFDYLCTPHKQFMRGSVQVVE